MAKAAPTKTTDLPPYADLKARAKELGINAVGVRGTELQKKIQAEEARIAAETADKGEQATADAVAAANETPTGSDDEAGDDEPQVDEPKKGSKKAAAYPVPTLEEVQAAGYTEQAARVIVAQEQEKADQLAGKRSARNAGKTRIERQNATTWWCPIDGHSMPQYMQGCALCGAKREGDEVIPLRGV